MSKARRVAPDYGGDLARPVTGVGWSRGASLMLSGALHRTPTGAGAACARDLPLPEVVVGMNGCYYEWAGRPQPFPVEELDRREADVLLVAASADRNCPAWQSTRAAAALRAEGFRATVATIPGANHFTLILSKSSFEVVGEALGTAAGALDGPTPITRARRWRRGMPPRRPPEDGARVPRGRGRPRARSWRASDGR